MNPSTDREASTAVHALRHPEFVDAPAAPEPAVRVWGFVLRDDGGQILGDGQLKAADLAVAIQLVRSIDTYVVGLPSPSPEIAPVGTEPEVVRAVIDPLGYHDFCGGDSLWVGHSLVGGITQVATGPEVAR